MKHCRIEGGEKCYLVSGAIITVSDGPICATWLKFSGPEMTLDRRSALLRNEQENQRISNSQHSMRRAPAIAYFKNTNEVLTFTYPMPCEKKSKTIPSTRVSINGTSKRTFLRP